MHAQFVQSGFNLGRGILNPRLLDEKIPFPYIKDHMILETFASSHKYAFFRD